MHGDLTLRGKREQKQATTTVENNNTQHEEHQNIAFLKVHKAASSTVQNILFRYGLYRNLTFVLPRPPGFYWRNVISLRKSLTEKNILPPPKNKSYNILCNHVIYNKEAFQKIMPSNTKYIGIVREPMAYFESVLRYTHTRVVFNKRTAGNDPIAKYLENPSLYEYANPLISNTNNRMAAEFGFPLHLFKTKNSTGIDGYIRELDKNFHHVMVVELFEESVALMRRLLGWNFQDILFIALNHNIKHKESYHWTNTTISNFQKWNILDVKLYNFFKSRLLQEIEKEGAEFKNEVWYLKFTLGKVKHFCSRIKTPPMIIKQSKWNDPFEISEDDCLFMGMSEIAFQDFIMDIQYPEIGTVKGMQGTLFHQTMNALLRIKRKNKM